MSDTQHSLADGEGKEAFGQVGGEDLARLVRIGRAIGQADTSLEEVMRTCVMFSLLYAEEYPSSFKEHAKIFSPKNHIFVKPAREGAAVYNCFSNAAFALQGEQAPKTDTIADLLAKGALVACEPPEKTKEKADDNRFQFPWGLPGQSVDFGASQAGTSTQKRRMLVGYTEMSKPAHLACEVFVGEEITLQRFADIEEATITFTTDTGRS